MPLTFTQNSASISTTEYSFMQNAAYSANSPITRNAEVQGEISLAAMTGADVYRFRMYRKTLGTSEVVYEHTTPAGVQPGPFLFPKMMVSSEGWDATGLLITGSAKILSWSFGEISFDTTASIADAVWDEQIAGHLTAGSAGVTIFNTITGSAIADSVWDEQIAGHLTAGSTGVSLFNSTSGSIIADSVWDEASSAHLTAGSMGASLRAATSGSIIADSVWDEESSAHLVANSMGASLRSATSGSIIADSVWDEARAGHVAAGTFGEGVIINSIANNAITAASIAADAGTEIAAAVWAFAHESGRTVKGVMVRLDAIIAGKATGLNGTTVTFYRADGTTKAIEATQDTGAGTRETASTISGD